MSQFAVNQIVKGRRCGTYVIVALRTLPGEPGVQYAQVKELHPVNHNPRRGEMCFPVTDLVPAIETLTLVEE